MAPFAPPPVLSQVDGWDIYLGSNSQQNPEKDPTAVFVAISLIQ